MDVSSDHIPTLFELVKQTIERGIAEKRVVPPMPELMSKVPFSEQAATFVTLHYESQLRGCIGSLEAHRSLYEDVVANSFSAAFRDPRFQPVQQQELDAMNIEISLLTQPELIGQGLQKSELIEQLTPYKDGLIISDGLRKATFLPSVWQQLEDKEDFVNHLMRKAGMSDWTDNVICQRYFVNAYSKDWLDVS